MCPQIGRPAGPSNRGEERRGEELWSFGAFCMSASRARSHPRIFGPGDPDLVRSSSVVLAAQGEPGAPMGSCTHCDPLLHGALRVVQFAARLTGQQPAPLLRHHSGRPLSFASGPWSHECRTEPSAQVVAISRSGAPPTLTLIILPVFAISVFS